MKRNIFIFLAFVFVFPAQGVRAGLEQFKITMPDGKDDILEIGPIDQNGIFVAENFYIENPTEDTLIYVVKKESNSALTIWLGDPCSGEIDTIAPHSAKREEFIVNVPLINYDADFGAIVIMRKPGDTAVYATEKISADFSMTSSSTTSSKDLGVRSNQIVYFTNFADRTKLFSTTDTVHIVNTSDTTVFIKTIFLLEGSEYSITSFSNPNFPVRLGNLDTLFIFLKFKVNPDSLEWNKLFVVTDTDYAALNASYHCRPAKQNPLSSVAQDRKLTAFSVTPNPASGSALINISENYLPSIQVSISDALGREIASLKTSGESIRYDVSNLSNGVYYCTVQSAAGRETRKFVVSH
jgi:hypothetical protein